MLAVVDTVHVVTSLLSFSFPTLSTSFLNTAYKYTLPYTLRIAHVSYIAIPNLGKAHLLSCLLIPLQCLGICQVGSTIGSVQWATLHCRPFSWTSSLITSILIYLHFVQILDLDGDVCLHDHLPDSGEVHVHGPPARLSPLQVYSLLFVLSSTWHGLLCHLHPAQLLCPLHQAFHNNNTHVFRHRGV